MTDERRRRHWTADEKMAIVEEARRTGQSVSEVCRRHQIAVSMFYEWEKQARRGALEALRNSRPGRPAKDPGAVYAAEIDRLRVVVAELSIENLQLKKGLWS